MARQPAHTLRIIGGRWRGRRIAVNTADGLRPTPNRIRETLFNWLAPHIEGARCLDLFAGTGALGLEALSRGAAHVTFVDRNRDNTRALRETLSYLDCRDGAVVTGDGLSTATLPQTRYDVAFVDPPFAAGLHNAALAAIQPRAAVGARVYLEYPAAHGDEIMQQLPPAWRLSRSKRAGRVGYCLVEGKP